MDKKVIVGPLCRKAKKSDIKKIHSLLQGFALIDDELGLGVLVEVSDDAQAEEVIAKLRGKFSVPYLASLYTGRNKEYHVELWK